LITPSARTLDIWWISLLDPYDENCLTPEEKRQADRFATPRLRTHYSAAHAGLRQALAHYRDDSAREPFTLNRYGKPEWPQSAVSFNLTHSGDLAACVIADGMAVGIDIEQIKPLDDLPSIAALVFSDRERALLAAADPDQRLKLFYRLWVMKEAIIKALGLGFSYPATEFGLTTPLNEAQMVAVPGHGQWWVSPIPAPEGYFAACSAPYPSILREN
jgi:4'-phosphopantetheinyl transferase